MEKKVNIYFQISTKTNLRLNTLKKKNDVESRTRTFEERKISLKFVC